MDDATGVGVEQTPGLAPRPYVADSLPVRSRLSLTDPRRLLSNGAPCRT